jgi:hypothetical protein
MREGFVNDPNSTVESFKSKNLKNYINIIVKVLQGITDTLIEKVKKKATSPDQEESSESPST